MPTADSAPPGVDKRGERIRALFSSIAPRYDLLNHLLSLNIDRSWRRRLVKATAPEGGDDSPVLDVCTGTGDLALAWAAAWPGVRVEAVDFCPEMLDVARAKAAKRKAAVNFAEADAQAIPFPDGCFQLSMVAFGLRNVADTKKGLAELVRVVRPGGRVAILEFSRPTNPLLRSLYMTYFRRVLPRIGQKLAPNQEAAYDYLPSSVLEFPDGGALTALMDSAGLENSTATPLTFGIATLYIGRKRGSPSN